MQETQISIPGERRSLKKGIATIQISTGERRATVGNSHLGGQTVGHD